MIRRRLPGSDPGAISLPGRRALGMVLCLMLLLFPSCGEEESPSPYLSFFRGEEQLYLGMTRGEADAILGECADETDGMTHHEFYVTTEWYGDGAVGISLINDASDWVSGFGVGIGSSPEEVQERLGHLPVELDVEGYHRVYTFALEKGKAVPPADLEAPDLYQIGVSISYDSPAVEGIWVQRADKDELMRQVYLEAQQRRREEAKPPSMGEWDPPGYLNREAFFQALDQWVEAYRSGEYAQIYIDGPGDGMFHTWRLTCDGSRQYVIENRSWGGEMPVEGYYSNAVSVGAIHYSFGADVTENRYLPITLLRDDYTMMPLGQDTGEWERQKALSVYQAEAFSEVMMRRLQAYYSYGVDEIYRVTSRFSYGGQWFYGISIYGSGNGYQGQVAVSADGLLFMTRSMVDGSWWVAADFAEQQALPGGENRPAEDPRELWRSGEPSPSPLAEQLIGVWHGDNASEADGDRYLFLSDGTYLFGESRVNPAAERRYSAGDWWLEGSTIHLSARKILNYKGQDLEEALFWHSFELQELVDSGEYEYILRSEAERQVSSYPVEIVSGDPEAPFSIRMGEYQLWHMDARLDDMLAFWEYGE